MGETRGPAARQGRKVTLDLILIGLVITLEPIPLTAFVLILASERGTRQGAGFILGWLASLAAMIAITLAAELPPDVAEGNWLPAPRGRFRLGLRAYYPEGTILEGTWTPPAVTKVA